MKIKPIILILMLLCPMIANGQSKQSTTELSKLRDEYIESTKEYKASLERLLALYQDSARKAEQRVGQSQKLLADGLISTREVERSESALAEANLKVSGAQQQIANADTEFAQTLKEISKPETTAKLAREYKRASARRPSCRNWTLTASHQQRGRTVIFAFKLVCKD